MYPITHLYVVNRHTLDILDRDKVSPKEFQEYFDLNTKLYITLEVPKKDLHPEVEWDDLQEVLVGNENVCIDYTRYYTDQHTAKVETWEELENIITPEMIIGYQVTLPGIIPGTITPDKQVVSWDVMTTLNTFDVTYGSWVNGMKGQFAFRWNLKDLVISLNPSASFTPNLNNCLPLVNGIVCRPKVELDSKTIYAVNGAELCWNIQVNETPEIQLLDFSRIGDISIASLFFNTDEKPTDKRVSVKYAHMDHEWFFHSALPLSEYVPMIVLNGYLVLPDQYRIVNNHTFAVHPGVLPLNKISAYRAVKEGKTDGSGEIAYSTEEPILQLLTEYEDNNFVIYVKTPSMYITRSVTDVWNNDMNIHLYIPEGLILHNATGTIRCFYQEVLQNMRTLTIQNTIPIYMTDMEMNAIQTTHVTTECKHNPSVNIEQGTCTLLYIMR